VELAVVARNRRNLADRRLGLGARNLGIAAGTLDQPRGHAFGIIEQNFQQMHRQELLVALAERKGLRALDEAARPLGVFFDVHVCSSLHAGPPRLAALGRTPRSAWVWITRKGVIRRFTTRYRKAFANEKAGRLPGLVSRMLLGETAYSAP